MTDKKLIIFYKKALDMLRVTPAPYLEYSSAEECCNDVGAVLGWLINVRCNPIDDPKVILASYSDYGLSNLGVASFCPYCGAEIELREAIKE